MTMHRDFVRRQINVWMDSLGPRKGEVLVHWADQGVFPSDAQPPDDIHWALVEGVKPPWEAS